MLLMEYCSVPPFERDRARAAESPRAAERQRASRKRRATRVGVRAREGRRARARLRHRARARNGVRNGQCVGAVERERAIVGDVGATKRTRRATVTDLQRAAGYRRDACVELLPVRISVPAPIFSSGRAPPVSEMSPDWVAVPVVTRNCAVFELSTIGLATVTPFT